jgi:hypothetical protein
VLGKLSGSNNVTLVRLCGHQGISGNENANRLVQERTLLVPVFQTAGIPFIVCKVRKDIFGTGVSSKVECLKCLLPFQNTIRYSAPSRPTKFSAIIILRLMVSVVLLRGQRTLRGHMYKLETYRTTGMPTVWER